MAVGPGEEVPDVELRFADGSVRRLHDLLDDGPVVLFFYPKAFTPGCTAESCYFRDLGEEFDLLGAQRIGVSRDDVPTQARFRDELGLDYDLVADTDGTVARAFGAKRLGPLWSKRLTVVIGKDRTVKAVIRSESDPQRHADDALAALHDA